MINCDTLSKSDRIAPAMKSSLLKKYDIPLHYLDYSHIEKCTSANELENIVHILRSGEEGHFPDLLEKAELKLSLLKPNSKFLRKSNPVLPRSALDEEEQSNIRNDLTNFLKDMKESSKELDYAKNNNINSDVPVRSVKKIYTDQTKNTPKRIAATDYASWDKYDADAEILKINIAEEKLKTEAAKFDKQNSPTEKIATFSPFKTKTEAEYYARCQKERGNECIRVGDFDQALVYYTICINLAPTSTAYTNRAYAHIEKKQYQEAIGDCEAAIRLNFLNLKAHYRKAKCHDVLKEYKLALESAEQVLALDSNHKYAQKLQERALGALNTVRMQIQDVHSVASDEQGMKNVEGNLERKQQQENAEEAKKLCISLVLPYPGTSRMPPPYYATVNLYNDNDYTNYLQECNRRLQTSFVPIPVQDEDCLKIHIKPSDKLAEKYKTLDIADDSKIPPTKEMFEHNPVDVNLNGLYQKEYLGNFALQKQKNIKRAFRLSDRFDSLNDLSKKGKKGLKLRCTPPQFKATDAEINPTGVTKDDKGGGGEPYVKEETNLTIPTEIHSPFTFLKTWNAIGQDCSYAQHAEVLRNFDMNRFREVIGYNMNSKMLSDILKCLYRHFMVASEVDRVYSALLHLTNIPRFNLYVMFMSHEDRISVQILIEFLTQHDKKLPDDIKNKYLK